MASVSDLPWLHDPNVPKFWGFLYIFLIFHLQTFLVSLLYLLVPFLKIVQKLFVLFIFAPELYMKGQR